MCTSVPMCITVLELSFNVIGFEIKDRLSCYEVWIIDISQFVFKFLSSKYFTPLFANILVFDSSFTSFLLFQCVSYPVWGTPSFMGSPFPAVCVSVRICLNGRNVAVV